MNLYELTKKYSNGKGEDMMWKTLSIVSDAVESSMSEEDKKCMLRKVYGAMSDGHYNEEFAQEDVAKMFYKGPDGKDHRAPYWTVEQVRDVYASVSRQIPDYNFWDFYVTLQMTKADNCPLLTRWFPNATADEKDKMLVEMAVNWLDDPDSPSAGHKIWSYLNK